LNEDNEKSEKKFASGVDERTIIVAHSASNEEGNKCVCDDRWVPSAATSDKVAPTCVCDAKKGFVFYDDDCIRELSFILFTSFIAVQIELID
jgi:hypothetical protein